MKFIKRVGGFWINCWKASFKTKIGETKYWIQYYNIWTNGITTVRKQETTTSS